MTACRARMCDGTPVTFDWIDQGDVGGCYVSEMIGEGFYVRSVWPDYSLHGRISRENWDRLALQLNGVDTATVERKNELGPPPWLIWVPVFPPKYEDAGTSYFLEAMSMPPPPSPQPKVWHTLKSTYVGAEGLVTEAMLEAGAKAVGDCTLRDHPQAIASKIWRAMEKARK